jgi:hypothetical protein
MFRLSNAPTCVWAYMLPSLTPWIQQAGRAELPIEVEIYGCYTLIEVDKTANNDV